MKMTEMMNELMAEMDEVVGIAMKQAFSMNMVANMSMDELTALQKCASLLEKSKEVAFAQAKMMDDQNEKLDKLLRLLEKKES